MSEHQQASDYVSFAGGTSEYVPLSKVPLVKGKVGKGVGKNAAGFDDENLGALLTIGGGIDSSAAFFDGLSFEADAPVPNAPPRKEGWLYKEGHSSIANEGGKLARGIAGRRRYFVLSNGILEYFVLPQHSPRPWGTHLVDTPDDESGEVNGVHATNARGHICLFNARLSQPKGSRKDGKGAARPAFRLDCDPSAAAVYNETWSAHVLLTADVNKAAATEGKLNKVDGRAARSESLAPMPESSSYLPSSASHLSALGRKLAGLTVGKFNGPASSKIRRSGPVGDGREGHYDDGTTNDSPSHGAHGFKTGLKRRLYGHVPACLTPTMHTKYVLAGENEIESNEWQEAIQAHIDFASSQPGMTGYHGVLNGREDIRKARSAGNAQAVKQTTTQKVDVGKKQRCENLYVGVGFPALLCQDCGAGKPGACVICSRTEGHSMIIRAACLCETCNHRAPNRCCRCDNELRGPAISPILCIDCGTGANAGRCCKMRDDVSPLGAATEQTLEQLPEAPAQMLPLPTPHLPPVPL